MGNQEKIQRLISENNLEIKCEIIDPMLELDLCAEYAHSLYEKRKRKGVTLYEARKLMRDRNYFGNMMLELDKADVFISGLTKNYPKIIRPALQIIGVRSDTKVVAGMYVIVSKQRTLFFADTTVNANPSVEDLVNIIELSQESVRSFGFEPRIALLSYSNFGSTRGDTPEKMSLAVQKAKEKFPDLIIDGEIQANVALNQELTSK